MKNLPASGTISTIKKPIRIVQVPANVSPQSFCANSPIFQLSTKHMHKCT